MIRTVLALLQAASLLAPATLHATSFDASLSRLGKNCVVRVWATVNVPPTGDIIIIEPPNALPDLVSLSESYKARFKTAGIDECRLRAREMLTPGTGWYDYLSKEIFTGFDHFEKADLRFKIKAGQFISEEVKPE